MPRIQARVFAALLASDSGTLTSAELGQRLKICPAAVSGAVRYLAQQSTWSPGSASPARAGSGTGSAATSEYEALTNREADPSGAGRTPCARASSASAPTPRRAAASPRRWRSLEFLEGELDTLMDRWRVRRERVVRPGLSPWEAGGRRRRGRGPCGVSVDESPPDAAGPSCGRRRELRATPPSPASAA
ncbi:hypothetical protein SGLAM104S_05701 [Streptomyces glaucescens]